MTRSAPSEGPDSRRPPRRPRSRRRTLLLFVLLVLLAGVYARSRLDGWVHRALEQRLAETLDADVRIGDLELELTRLEARLRDVEVDARDEGAGWSRIAFERSRVRVRLATLSGLSLGRLHLADVSVTAPAVELRGPPAGDRPAIRPVRGLDVVIDRLHLERGLLRYEDREVPLDFTVAGVAVEAASGGASLIGNLAFHYELHTPALTGPLALDVSSGFRWRGEPELELLRFHAEGSGVELELDASVVLSPEPGFRSIGTLQADLDRLGTLLPDPDMKVAGSLSGAVEVRSGEEGLGLRGRLTTGPARFGPFGVAALQTDAVYEAGRLRLTGLDALAFDGRVTGDAGVDFGEPLVFDARLTGSTLDAAELLRFLELPLPLGARVAAAVEAGGDPRRTATWSGSGTFEMVPDAADPALLPTAAAGTVRLRPGRLSVEARGVEVATTRLDVGADVSVGGGADRTGEVRLVGEVAAAARTQRGTLRILEALDITLPPELAEPLEGAGRARARIGLGGPRDLGLELDLAHGSVGDRPFDRLRLDLALHGDAVDIRALDLVAGDQRLSGTAGVALEPLAVTALDAEATRLDSSWIAAYIPGGLPLTARVTGRMAFGPGAGSVGYAGGGRLALTDARILDEPVTAAAGELRFVGDRVVLDGVTLDGRAGTAGGSATVVLGTLETEVRLDRAALDLAEVGVLRESGAGLTGRVALDGTLTVERGGAGRGKVTVTGEDWRVRGYPLGDVRGAVDWTTDGLQVELRHAEAERWSTSAQVRPAGEWPVVGSLQLSGLRAGDPADPERPLAVTLNGAFGYRGPLARPEAFRIDGAVDSARLEVGAQALDTVEPVAFGLVDGVVHAEPIRVRGTGTDASARVRYDLGAASWDAGLEGALSLRLLSEWVPELRLSGQAVLDVALTGPAEHPELAGVVLVDQGRLRWTEFPDTFEQIEIDLRLAGQTAETRALRAVIGGGEVSGSGRLAFDGLAVAEYAADLDVAGVRLAIPEGFAGVYDGLLTIAGDREQVRLSGDARLLRGVYDEPFEFGGLLGFGVREVLAATAPDRGYPVLLDLDVVATDNVWLRNELAEVESAVDLHIGGSVDRPEVTGQITALEGGELTFRDVDYRIEHASLEFIERERLDPYLSLQARTTVRAHEILLRVEGTQDDFHYELTSNPALSSQDIIALLTTGHTLQDLTAAERDSTRDSYTGDVAANYFAGALTGRFEKQLQRLLGLERVRIDPLLVEGEGDPTTRITIGKEVADDLFVILSSDVGDSERQIYQIEWQASPQIRLTAERDELGSVGGDIQYTDRFRLRKPEPPAAEPAPRRPDESEVPRAARLAYLTIEGVPEAEAEALKARLPLRVGDPFSRSRQFEALQALRRGFVQEGRIETRVRSALHRDDATGEVALTFLVTPAPQVEVRFEGVSKKTARKLRDRLETLWIDSLFDEDLYYDSVGAIQDWFQERGFYAVDVHHQRGTTDAGPELVFHIDRGKPVTVAAVHITGNEQVDEERIRRQMLTRGPSFLSRKPLDPDVLDDDLRAVRNLYWNLGHLEVRVDPPRIRLSADADTAEVTVQIHEGPRFTIGSLGFPAGLPFDQARLADWAGLEVGDVFSPQGLVEAEGRLRAGLDIEGYADAEVRARFALEGESASVSFEVEAGDVKRLGEIAIAGNRFTKRKVIAREIDLEPGDVISRAEVLRIQHRLYGLGIFRSVRVGYRPLEGDATRQLLEVHVEEAEPLGLSVGGGYENEGDARVRLSLTHDNLAGRDRSVGLHARASRLVRRFQFTAEDRHLFGTGTPGLLNVAFEEREETAFTVNRRSIAIRGDRRRGAKWSSFLRYSFQRVDLIDVTDALAAREDKLVNISLGDVGLVVRRDTRDDPFLTRQGSLLSIEHRLFDEWLLSEAAFLKSTYTGVVVHSFENGTAVVSAARLGLAKPFRSTGQVPLSERFFAGGDSTLRGFSRDEVGPQQDGLPFGGEAVILFNEEFLFPIWEPLKGVVFVDIGNVYEKLSELDLDDMREVAGAGLRLETPIGALRLEYGWKLDRRESERRGEWVLAIGMAF